MFSPHSASFLESLEIPRVLEYGRVRETSNTKRLEKKQEVALSPVPLCKGELAHCQERVSMHDFYLCVWNMCWSQQWKEWDSSVPV